MSQFKSFLVALCLGAMLSSCSGNENKATDNDNTAEESTDNTVGANATSDTTTSMSGTDGTAMMAAGKTAQATISSASNSGLTWYGYFY
jgi:hypothetical protein